MPRPYRCPECGAELETSPQAVLGGFGTAGGWYAAVMRCPEHGFLGVDHATGRLAPIVELGPEI